MIRSLIVLFLWLWCLPASALWTDQKPTEAILVSFDQKCAAFREPNGKTVSVKKEALKNIPLEPKKTKIEYFPESLQKNQCDGIPRN